MNWTKGDPSGDASGSADPRNFDPSEKGQGRHLRLWRALVSLPLMLMPLAAEAIVVVNYQETDLECRSVELCETSGVCQETKAFSARLTFPAALYTSSFAPFSPGPSKWVRPVEVQFSGQASAQLSSYRTLSATDAEITQIWRKATAEQRIEGWFGPYLPATNDGPADKVSSYRVVHTRTRPSDNPKLFSRKSREMIVFHCHAHLR